MNELQKFNREGFGEIRTIDEDGKMLFCGSDVAKALGYSNAPDALRKHCRAIVKRDTPLAGKIQKINFIPEGDVYRLISHSKLPTAEEFESWIFDEVLPTIRKTGGYVKNTEQFLDFYVPDADEVTRAKFGAMVELSHQLNRQIRELKDDKEKNAPKVEFADAVSASNTSIMVGDMAKMLKQNGIKIGRQRLFKWLRENHYLMKGGEEYNMPTQRSMNQEWFEIKETIQYDKRNNPIICRTPKITGKGQRHLVRKFLELKERGEI